MRSWIVLAVLGSLCAFAHAQCDVEGGDLSVPFPNIENKAYQSYQMSVEYTVRGAGQTGYYTEYYDILNRRGRVEEQQVGKAYTYIYNPPTYEAWEITGSNCIFNFLSSTPEMFKHDQDEWLYLPDEKGKAERITVGPSAMLKVAYDVWYDTVNTSRPKVFYMGEYEKEVRGIKGIYWRRCDGEQSFVDYVFTGEKYRNPYGLKDFKTLPLRILLGGKREYQDPILSTRTYDIVQFQPFIPEGLRTFDFPSGRGCTRRVFSKYDDIPKPPDFSGKNLQFSAEVIYQTVDSNGDPNEYFTYYNTLSMALDVRSQLLAYHYSPWNKTAPKNKPEVVAPVYTIFDMKHGYLYRYNLTDGQCQIIRQRSFAPIFELPLGRGGISLTGPQVLFPNDESVFLREGVNRGLKVNVFEDVFYNYQLENGDEFITIPKSIITRTYLQNNVVVRNINSVRNALTQVQMRFIGRLKNRIMEIVTMNFYGFSTEIRNRQNTFNIKRCYKNIGDYVWITLTFNADESTLNKIKQSVPSIQSNVLNVITMGSELNAARIPVLEVDFSDALYVTMQILGKPPVLRDNDTFFPSTDLMVQNLRRQVHDGLLKIVIMDKYNNRIQLQASSIDVRDPGEDDRLWEHVGRKFSTGFKKNAGKRTVGSQLPPLTNLTLEECARACIEHGKGTCLGYDFCQGNTVLATSCILLDSDPNKMQLAPSPICNNYFRTQIVAGPERPYSISYAGGIGFLCFLIGGIVGVVIVLGIANLRYLPGFGGKFLKKLFKGLF